MAEPKSESTAADMAVIEAEISMQRVPRVWGCLAPLPSKSREWTR
jgi:hypothetical protein